MVQRQAQPQSDMLAILDQPEPEREPAEEEAAAK
jgi:hypothetical protein